MRGGWVSSSVGGVRVGVGWGRVSDVCGGGCNGGGWGGGVTRVSLTWLYLRVSAVFTAVGTPAHAAAAPVGSSSSSMMASKSSLLSL